MKDSNDGSLILLPARNSLLKNYFLMVILHLCGDKQNGSTSNCKARIFYVRFFFNLTLLYEGN